MFNIFSEILCQSAANLSIELYQSAALLCLTVVFMFIMCANGQMVTEKSFSIGQSVYETTWYKMPLKFRRHLLLMIQHSNRPFNLTACGLMCCNLEAFVTVSSGRKYREVHTITVHHWHLNNN